MRVIAGAFKGRNLKSPPSMQVRPTSDRLRETLFNVIASRRSCQLIESNLELCRVPEEQRDIYCSEASEFVRQWDGDLWDIVFFDPPYKEDYLKHLQIVSSSKLLHEGGLLIVEHHHKTELPEAIGSLTRKRILKQGDSSLSFYVC
jgi:16S rRNA G966 N2-methylase RsmD